MAFHELGPGEGLLYDYIAPGDGTKNFTFVFFNALTGDTAMWSDTIVPTLRDQGHGALLYNMRGQRESPFAPGTELAEPLIVADALALLERVKPQRPILVGLSIGGLFAARAHLGGAAAEALVLINTLRRDGPRLRWLNESTARCVAVGGGELPRDLLFPLLFDEEWLGANRKDFLGDGPYTPIDQNSGTYNLLKNAASADWDLPYERLAVPVLVVSGLQDRVFYAREVVDDLFGRLPKGHRLDVPNAGHLLPAERPEVISQALLDFAARI